MLRKFRIKINDKEYMVEMEELTASVTDTVRQEVEAVVPVPVPQKKTPAVSVVEDEESVLAPMPGTILDILVSTGDYVQENQVVAILEAMKMENEIVAPKAGVISKVLAVKSAAINVGEPIVFIS